MTITASRSFDLELLTSNHNFWAFMCNTTPSSHNQSRPTSIGQIVPERQKESWGLVYCQVVSKKVAEELIYHGSGMLLIDNKHISSLWLTLECWPIETKVRMSQNVYLRGHFWSSEVKTQILLFEHSCFWTLILSGSIPKDPIGGGDQVGIASVCPDPVLLLLIVLSFNRFRPTYVYLVHMKLANAYDCIEPDCSSETCKLYKAAV